MSRLVPRGKIGQRVLGTFSFLLLFVAIGMGIWRLAGIVRPKPPSQVVTIAVETGRNPDDGEQWISAPISEAVMALAGVESVEARTDDGHAVVRVTAAPAKPEELPLEARVREALEPHRLPDDVMPPVVMRVASDTVDDYWTVTAPQMAPTELGAWAEKHLRLALQQTAGVRSVTLCGPGAPVPVVGLDAERLRAFGLDAVTVFNLLRAEAVKRPGGIIFQRAPSLETLGNTPLNEKVRLSDVARVSLESPAAKCRALLDGTPVLLVDVTSGGAGPQRTIATPPGGKARRLGEVAEVELWLASPESLGMAQVEAALVAAGEATPVLVLDGTAKQSPARVLLSPPPDAVKVAEVMRALASVPGVAIRGVRGVAGSRVVVTGDDREALEQAARAVAAAPGLHLFAAVPPTREELSWRVDRDRAVALGVRTDEIATAIQVATGASADGVTVKLDGVESPEQLGALEVKSGVRLQDVASGQLSTSPAERLLVDGRRAVEVFVPGGRPDDVSAALAKVRLPPGVVAYVVEMQGLPTEP